MGHPCHAAVQDACQREACRIDRSSTFYEVLDIPQSVCKDDECITRAYKRLAHLFRHAAHGNATCTTSRSVVSPSSLGHRGRTFNHALTLIKIAYDCLRDDTRRRVYHELTYYGTVRGDAADSGDNLHPKLSVRETPYPGAREAFVKYFKFTNKDALSSVDVRRSVINKFMDILASLASDNARNISSPAAIIAVSDLSCDAGTNQWQEAEYNNENLKGDLADDDSSRMLNYLSETNTGRAGFQNCASSVDRLKHEVAAARMSIHNAHAEGFRRNADRSIDLSPSRRCPVGKRNTYTFSGSAPEDDDTYFLSVTSDAQQKQRCAVPGCPSETFQPQRSLYCCYHEDKCRHIGLTGKGYYSRPRLLATQKTISAAGAGSARLRQNEKFISEGSRLFESPRLAAETANQNKPQQLHSNAFDVAQSIVGTSASLRYSQWIDRVPDGFLYNSRFHQYH